VISEKILCSAVFVLRSYLFIHSDYPLISFGAPPMVRLDENRFLTELTKMFDKTKENGSIWITMKKSNDKPISKKKAYPEEDYQCLVRAVVGGKKDKKREITTLVPAGAMLKFHQSMNVIMKVRTTCMGRWACHMEGKSRLESLNPMSTSAACHSSILFLRTSYLHMTTTVYCTLGSHQHCRRPLLI
jgi:signal recognition particle subunit SRP14